MRFDMRISVHSIYVSCRAANKSKQFISFQYVFRPVFNMHIHIYMTFLSKTKQTHSTSDNFENQKNNVISSFQPRNWLICIVCCMHHMLGIHPFACNAFNVLANILFFPSILFTSIHQDPNKNSAKNQMKRMNWHQNLSW